jgi:hypothetical protein
LSAHRSTKIIRSTDPFNFLLSRNGAINHVNVERYCTGPVGEAKSVGAFVALTIVFRVESSELSRSFSDGHPAGGTVARLRIKEQE